MARTGWTRFAARAGLALAALALGLALPRPALAKVFLDPQAIEHWAPTYALVDDFEGTDLLRDWYYSRMGTDRGAVENGSCSVTLGNGQAQVTVSAAGSFAGVWTTLMHTANEHHSLDISRLLGPYVKDQYQPSVSRVKLSSLGGSGTLKVELKDVSNNPLWVGYSSITAEPRTFSFIPSVSQVPAMLVWIVDGPGSVAMDRVWFSLDSPEYTPAEAVFLLSYSHLSQCWDPASSLMRDRATFPSGDFDAVPATGVFALITALAYQMGYVEQATALNIVGQIRTKLGQLPKYHGVLPHFLKNGQICPDTEYSTVDTAICLLGAILGCQIMGLDTSSLEQMVRDIDWDDLTTGGTRSISHGYAYDQTKLPTGWDVFGGESLMLAVLYAAANGGGVPMLETHDKMPTWDGSGFNDAIAGLFFPCLRRDAWGNAWNAYQAWAFDRQYSYFAGHQYQQSPLCLFGLSASEVPEPWRAPEDAIYRAWGVGGHNGVPNDGSQLAHVEYPIIAPHYAAMVAAEHQAEFECLFDWLINVQHLFSPLNNVESFNVSPEGQVRWNSLKGSWNLTLQALGAARAGMGQNYGAWQALEQNAFLSSGHEAMFPCNCGVTCHAYRLLQ